MNSFLTWTRLNLGIPLVMVAFTTILLGLYQSGECNQNEYHNLRSSLPTGSVIYRVEVREAMADGKVSRWEYATLLKSYWVSARVLSLGGPVGRTEEERAGLVKDLTSLKDVAPNVKPM